MTKLTPRQIGALRRHRNATGFRGVFYDRDRAAFRAEVGYHGGRIRGKRRDDAVTAAKDYDAMARARYGKDAHLNFPNEGELFTLRIEPNPGFCAYGHDLTYYGYVDQRRPNTVNCRQCNAWAAIHYKQRKQGHA